MTATLLLPGSPRFPCGRKNGKKKLTSSRLVHVKPEGTTEFTLIRYQDNKRAEQTDE